MLLLVDTQKPSVGVYFAYVLIGFIVILLFWIAWRSVEDSERPRWLISAIAVAFILRLGVGVGLFHALPVWGYADSRPHRNGFLFRDAYNRDLDAWELSRSEQSLTAAWNNPDLSDQYGGLLFLSALQYRTLSPEAHRPFLTLIITAAVGSIAVLYTWTFTNRSFNSRAGQFAAWLVALYPEAVFLSASPMRESFLITAIAIGIEGYTRLRVGERRRGAIFILVGFLLALVISPPTSLILLAIVAVAWIWEGRIDRKHIIWVIVGAVVLGVGALALTLRAWASLEGRPGGGILELINWWFLSGAEYQLHLLIENSGWVQKIFGMVPEWSQLPLATAYGLIQPFLPAALMDSTSAPLIRAIVSLRALGWFFLLPFLIYSLPAALRYKGWRSLQTYFAIIVWIGVIVASYRDAGRMWDNPRWRVILLCIQAAIAGWAWVSARRRNNPWLLRTGIIVVFATLAFIHWEAGRYYGLPRLNLWETLFVIAAFSSVFILGSIAYDRWRARGNGT